MPPTQVTPAQSLADAYKTLQPDPLISADELKAFYREELNTVRGGDKVARLAQGLDRAYTSQSYFKAFFMGHQGVGKSTELSRLEAKVASNFQTIRFSAVNNLDARNFKSLDIILTMMVDVAERTRRPIKEGGAGRSIPEQRLREIRDWFADEKEMRIQDRGSGVTIEGGAGVSDDSLWHKILGLFAKLKGEMKFTQSRKIEIVERRFSRLPDLIEIANRLLDDCNRLLREERSQEWLFIGEDFDKSAIPRPVIEELFIGNADVFRQLRAHMIMTLPLGLYYSGKAVELPFSSDRCVVLPDTHVFDRQHRPYAPGQQALAEVLQARINLNLLEPGQMERLVMASGGNLRDLFALTNYAADTAQLRPAEKIGAKDVDEAIINLRNDYQRRLGSSPYDPEEISYADKSQRLQAIYKGQSQDQITDGVVYSLLQSRALQEFNGARWFGVHPLVVDILVTQGIIVADQGGGVPGGTQ
jgi:hypothetical protein